MKKLIFILCFCSTVSLTYGQVKVSLSYQYESSKATSTDIEVPNSDYSGTVQANVIWQFSPYLSAFTGVGYNSRTYDLNTTSYNYNRDLQSGIMFCGVGCYEEEAYGEQSFSNIEVPLGIRVNTPSYLNFEMGLSMGVVAATTVSQSETYTDNSYLWSCIPTPSDGGELITNSSTQRSYYGSRIDVGLDIRYSLGKVWQISLAGTWSPYDWRVDNSQSVVTNSLSELGNLSSRVTTDQEVTTIKNGQKGVRLGMLRSF